MGKIFISYRRDDSGGWAGRLWDKLETRFGRDNLFMDIDTIEPGVDFVEAIDQTVKSCDILLAVIGKRWVSTTDGQGRRRLENESDFVRLEVAAALRRKIRVIPVLVGGAEMPRPEQLPRVLKRLSRRNAFEIRDSQFHGDVDRLIPVLERILKARADNSPDRRATKSGAAEVQAGTIRMNPIDGLEYVWIPPGEFKMGALEDDWEAFIDEKPRHRVKISHGFWLSRTPVTVAAYKRFCVATGRAMPDPPSFNPGWEKSDHPIVRVGLDDAQDYAKWASARLPSEAEWEYAARGGRDGTKYPWGGQITPQNANFFDSKLGGTTSVAQYAANDFGLYDVCGNVWEWTGDRWSKEYYDESPSVDPPGPDSGNSWVVRGGSWCSEAGVLRLSSRLRIVAGGRDDDLGFRCAGRDVR